jgi:histidyl-tRNA synthetase
MRIIVCQLNPARFCLTRFVYYYRIELAKYDSPGVFMSKKIHHFHDIMPEDVWKWKYLETQVEQVLSLYNYQEIRLSVLQDYDILHKGITALLDTDEVNHVTQQILSLNQPDEHISLLSLRPEGTISVLHKFAEMYEPGKTNRFYYHGPMFRKNEHHQPMEFYQLGVELLGSDSILSENEIISLGMKLCEHLGLNDAWLEINSFGCESCRPVYFIAMREHLEEHKDDYCRECFDILQSNPLQVINCINKECHHHTKVMPKIQDFLCKKCKDNFTRVKKIQANLANTYKVNHFLFTNFSYYNETVFNFMLNTPGGTKVIGGGGRYDFLSNQVTGKQIPAVGFYFNLDSIYRIMSERKLFMPPEQPFRVYICSQSPELEIMTLQIVQELHQQRLSSLLSAEILDTADEIALALKFECQAMIILREDNIREGKVLLRNLGKEKQDYIPLADLIPGILLIKKSLSQ